MKLRADVEDDTLHAARRALLGAVGATCLAVVTSVLLPGLFLVVAFVALVAWFVGVALVMLAAREAVPSGHGP